MSLTEKFNLSKLPYFIFWAILFLIASYFIAKYPDLFKSNENSAIITYYDKNPEEEIKYSVNVEQE